MPFCPKCKGEFQNWVKTCPDCGVNLVDALPPKPEKTPLFSDTSLVAVASFSFPTEAHLWRAKLLSVGIPAFVSDEIVSQSYGAGAVGGGIKLMVRESDLMRAAMVLKDVKDSVPEQEPPDECYRCPKCDSTNVNLKCGDCGHEWVEEESDESEETES